MNNNDILKGIINEERFDSSLYMREALLFKNKIIAGNSISEIFREFATDESVHIKMLLSIYNKKITFKTRKILLYKSLRETLRMHLLRERDSIKLYEVLFNLADNLNERIIIKKIIESEKKHLSVIRKYLIKIG